MNTPKKVLLTTLAVAGLGLGVASCRQPTQPPPVVVPNEYCNDCGGIKVDGNCVNDNCITNYIPTPPPPPTELAAPANVALNGTVLSWSNVPNAAGFRLYVNGVAGLILGNETSINIADLRLTTGSHNIQVRALAEHGSEFLDSNLSDETSISVTQQTGMRVPLFTPNLTVAGNILSWDAVEDAIGFRIYLPNGRPPVVVNNATSIDLKTLGLEPGKHQLSVRALADPENGRLMNSGAAIIDIEIQEPHIEPTPLAAPTNVQLTGTALSWGAVSNAVGFRIYVNGIARETVGNETSINIADLSLGIGTHNIQVRALAEQDSNFVDSDLSEETTVSITQATPIRIPLQTPSNLTITGTTLSWDDVPNAIGFRVYLPGDRAPIVVHSGTSLDLSTINPPLPVGSHNLQVRALADPTIANQMNSNTADISFEVAPQIVTLPAPTNVQLTGTALSWGAVSNAVGFRIYVNGIARETVGNETSINIADLSLGIGTHNIQVRALAEQDSNFVDSDLSEETTVSITQATPIRIPLQTPSNLTITGTTLSWDDVPNAIGFRVYLPGDRAPIVVHSGTSLDLSTINPPLPVGSHNLQVRALADPTVANQMNSNTADISFEVAPQIVTLPAPASVTISGTTVSWGSVAGNHGFAIYVGGIRRHTTAANATSFNLSNLTPPLGVGNHSIQVRSLSEVNNQFQLDSDLSDTANFTVNPPTVTLPAPASVTISGTTVSWGSVAGNHGFAIYVGGIRRHATAANATSFNLSNLTPPLGVGNHSIQVRSLSEVNNQFQLDSELSGSANFTVNPPTVTLPAPASVTISGTTVSWGSVAGNHGFAIYVGGIRRHTTAANATSFNLSNLTPPLGVGNHSIQVRSLSEVNNQFQLDSDLSDSANFTVNPPTVTLPAPASVTISGTTVSWGSVAGNHGFAIYVGGIRRHTTTANATSFNLSNLTPPLGVGNHSIQVRSLSEVNNQFQLDSDLSGSTQFNPNIASFKERFGAGIVFGDRLPSGYQNWGQWKEAMITAAIRAAEIQVRNAEFPGWQDVQKWPFILTNMLVPSNVAGFPNGVVQHPTALQVPAQNAVHLQNLAGHSLVPGFNFLQQDGNSFARPGTIGSGMIIHEEFIERGSPGMMSPDGFIPCIPGMTVDQAKEFHRIAIHNIFTVGPYIVNGEEIRLTDDDFDLGYDWLHNVFSHFGDFVTSDRFTNNTLNPFGLEFNPNGFGPNHALPPSENRQGQGR